MSLGPEKYYDFIVHIIVRNTVSVYCSEKFLAGVRSYNVLGYSFNFLKRSKLKCLQGKYRLLLNN